MQLIKGKCLNVKKSRDENCMNGGYDGGGLFGEGGGSDGGSVGCGCIALGGGDDGDCKV